ncbi:hypothetical protein V2G26_005170 [Clonostachys chloroleuca]
MDDPEGAGLPLRRLDQVAWAYGRYNRIFEDPDTIQERIPNTNYLDAGITAKSPWIIEAPLNTVEIIEAILKPKEPFKSILLAISPVLISYKKRTAQAIQNKMI